MQCQANGGQLDHVWRSDPDPKQGTAVPGWDSRPVADGVGQDHEQDISIVYNRAFNQPLDSWQTDSVMDLYGAFTATTVFNQPLNSGQFTRVHFTYCSATSLARRCRSIHVSPQ